MATQTQHRHNAQAHYCNAAGCLAHVSAGQLMCRRHAAMLSEDLSAAMHAGVRSRAHYKAAACAAILHVAELEGRPTVALRRCLAKWRELAEKSERATP